MAKGGASSQAKSPNAKEAGLSFHMRTLSNFDFGFAFREPAFADRILRLIFQEACQDGKCERVCEEAFLSSCIDIPVTSAILASKSDFFYRLFTNGMKESINKTQPIELHLAREEAIPFLELLSTIYKGTVCPTFASSLENVVHLLVLADRFCFRDCMVVCGDYLQGRLDDLSPVEASLILNQAPVLLADPSLYPLVAPSKACLVKHFGPLIASAPDHPEFLQLSLPVAHTVLESDHLCVKSEDLVFEAVMHWVSHNCSTIGERKRAATQLCKCVRFSWMSPWALKKTVMLTAELDPEIREGLVMDALADVAERKASSGNLASSSPPRNSYRPFDVLVTLDLSLKDCRKWCASPDIPVAVSQPVHIRDGKWCNINLYLEAVHNIPGPRLGFYLALHKFTELREGEETVKLRHSVGLKDAARPLGSADLCPELRRYHVDTFKPRGSAWGYEDFFLQPWSEVLADPEKYFPNGVMRIQASVWLEDGSTSQFQS